MNTEDRLFDAYVKANGFRNKWHYYVTRFAECFSFYPIHDYPSVRSVAEALREERMKILEERLGK